MDVDMMRPSPPPPSSSNQEHLDMVSMMFQMDKLRDFYYPNYQTTLLPFTGIPVQEPRVKYAPVSQPQQRGGGAYMSSIEKKNSTAGIREMIFRIAAMQPIQIDPEAVKPLKRRNVRISKDPQSVAARHRRERISEKIRILQRLVPGGTKMDTASMLDEAIHYVKFLKKQVQTLEQVGGSSSSISRVSGLIGGGGGGLGLSSSGVAAPAGLGYFSLGKNYHPSGVSMVGSNSMQMLRCLDDEEW